MGVLALEHRFLCMLHAAIRARLHGHDPPVYTYGWDMGWGPLNLVSTIGAFLMGIGFLFQVWQIALQHQIRRARYDGRSVECAARWNGRFRRRRRCTISRSCRM